jgi:redox-sensing transcriptional repressor
MKADKQPSVFVSTQALQRMPYYLQYLKRLRDDGLETVAAPAIAQALRLNEVQVRKDFASISTTRGKPRAGFAIAQLIRDMESFLGYHNVQDAILAGAGSLGRALLSYQGFDGCGMHIVAAFDTDPQITGSQINEKKILPADRLSEICRRLGIHIGIIAVPASQAQTVCDQMVAGGILAIWNFAPIHLATPEEILVKNENMAASLAMLSQHLQTRLSR